MNNPNKPTTFSRLQAESFHITHSESLMLTVSQATELYEKSVEEQEQEEEKRGGGGEREKIAWVDSVTQCRVTVVSLEAANGKSCLAFTE